MSFTAGSLVKARGREWVVLPDSDDETLLVRPLGGTDEEVTGIYLPLEGADVVSAQFHLPDMTLPGDAQSGRFLRDAVRLGFRSSAGPFQSFASIAVEPRPYQLVPLMMALRQDPVRLLISDDVGIGKTVEAALIARELLDRGEAKRLAVLCPPHLAEQWQSELREKFHIEAELVLASTAAQLERQCRQGESIFAHFKHLIISIDFIKADSRRESFVTSCPELVIVDEAHTCAYASEGRGGRHQRFQLVSSLAQDPTRHMILVTATPHSGDAGAFRSLLGLLNPDFKNLPDDLSGSENERYRQRLAGHFVQRQRVDIRSYLDDQTPFPERDEQIEEYSLTPEYKRLFERVLDYARETVQDTRGGRGQQRIRWWAVLGLLRALASSPAAAASTLRNRVPTLDEENVSEIDSAGRRAAFDLIDSDALEGIDVSPSGDFIAGEDDESRRERERLRRMASDAEKLRGEGDAKLQKALKLIAALVKEGYQPIVFCRFIQTAEYVAEYLRQKLPRAVQVVAITGQQPPAEREIRVQQLAEYEQRVLVCTDCLSEGINLQELFNAVFHYDLSWNPTRHEQREGRVDRFGQQAPRIKALTYYGNDNEIDGIVLNVLIRKHKRIRSELGISVPVPVDTEEVLEAIFEGVLRDRKRSGMARTANEEQQLLPGFTDTVEVKRDELHKQWDASRDREKRSRAIFAQRSIKVEEVARELREVRAAIGSHEDVAAFTTRALKSYGAFVAEKRAGGELIQVDVKDVPPGLRDALNIQRFTRAKGDGQRFYASFTRPGLSDTLYLTRTHPLVEGLAAYVMDTALDSVEDGTYKPLARRCGVIRTSRVARRTTLLLLRLRYQVRTQDRIRGLEERLAEECRLLAFRGSPQSAEWVEEAEHIEELLEAHAEANMAQAQAINFLRPISEDYESYIQPYLLAFARRRADELKESHRRVRRSASLRIQNLEVVPQLPPDILGVYVYLPNIQL